MLNESAEVNNAIVFVSDMSRCAAFHHDSIGLPLGVESQGRTEFATEGVAPRCTLATG